MSRARHAVQSTDAEIAEELASHLHQLEEAFVTSGMSPADAAAAAHAKFGNVDRVREECAAIVFKEARMKSRIHLALTISLAVILCGISVVAALRARAAQLAQREARMQAEVARQAEEAARLQMERAQAESKRPSL